MSENLIVEQRIIFFDGICNLCNRSVDFLYRKDKKHQFQFAALKGETAEKFLGIKNPEQAQSIIYLRNGKVLKQSSAVLQILVDLGGAYRFFSFFRIIPKSLRDILYQAVAKKRYKWFGNSESCRSITPEEQPFFLP